MPVKKSMYRRPLTPTGIEKMEKGTLDYFDETIFGNVNTGAMEQYFNEKAKVDSFERTDWIWKHVIIGIAFGLMFALINQYVGLKVGRIVGGVWYLVYLVGLSMRWKPTEVNIVGGIATGAAATCTGFVFSYPAIYLLAYAESGYPVLVLKESIPPIWAAVFATILGGMLGVLYFTIFRRVWLVEDPLPVPTIEASIKLVDMANDISSGSVEHAKKTLKAVFTWASISATFTFLRDFNLLRNSKPDFYGGWETVDGVRTWVPADRIPVLDTLFGGRYFQTGAARIPYGRFTSVGFNFVPIQIAVGWFMRIKTALLVTSGTMFAWFIIVPLSVGFNVPVYVPYTATEGAFFSVTDMGYNSAKNMFATPFLVYNDASAFVAFSRVARIIAVGAILGGGMTALMKMHAVFRTAMSDIPMFQKEKGNEMTRAGGSYVQGKGWYEWPMSHIGFMMALTPLGITAIFTLAGFPFLPSLIFGVLLSIVTFFLGAIGVKVMGEVGSTPVSGTSFIVLLMLLGVCGIFMRIGAMDMSTLIVMCIFGASIFGTALSLSSDIIFDFKVGIYAGTRPFYLVKGELTGVVLGATVAVVGSTLFSLGLAKGTIALEAPQANAFATLLMSLLGGSNLIMLISFIVVGFFIGVVAEITTGMGTAFGLGMYISLPVNLPIIVGGVLREWWTKKRLEPRAKRENWGEREITVANIDKYMIMTGLIIGEAIVGTFIAMTLIVPLFLGGA